DLVADLLESLLAELVEALASLDHLDQKGLLGVRRAGLRIAGVEVDAAELDQVLGPRDRIAERPVAAVDRRAVLDRGPAGGRVGADEAIRVIAARSLEVAALERVTIDLPGAREPEPGEVIERRIEGLEHVAGGLK